jgi:hypothetical protein
MSVTQTYYLAHTARGKLSYEASRSDHNLRLLVGHANLLDSLMLELAQAEQEQESWFNQSVKKATKTERPEHIQWADSIVEVEEEDSEADSDSESEFDSDEDIEMEAGLVSLQRVQSNQVSAMVEEVEEEFEDDGEEDFEGLQLHLTTSHSATSPPELDHDSDDSSEDDMPPSPPSNTLPSFSQKQALVTTSFYSKAQTESASEQDQALFDDGFYIPQRPNAGLISAISVY